jgi:hypothetical protein
MGVGEDFSNFSGNLAVTNHSSISDRYELITRGVPEGAILPEAFLA